MNPNDSTLPTLNPTSSYIVANVLHFRDVHGRAAMVRITPEEKTRLLAQGFRQERVPNRQAARVANRDHKAYFAVQGPRPKHGTRAEKEAARRRRGATSVSA